MSTASICLNHLFDEQRALEDYQGGVPRWCKGCGDNAILAAVQRLCRDEGLRPEKTVFVSGIGEILRRFGKVMTVEGTWGDSLEDELIDENNRRYTPLAMMLRSRYLVDVDCWSEARGQPIKPGNVVTALRAKLDEGK